MKQHTESGLDLFERPSTADTGQRNAFDLYETPTWMTRTLLHHQPIWCSRVLEPCAGAGAIARALRAEHHTVITNDLDPRQPSHLHHDATTPALWESPLVANVDWVITNPPFDVAFPILEQAWLLAEVGVAMLLRKTFLEPTRTRGAWLSVHPPDRIIGLPRHRFRGKGSDQVSTDWHIWFKPGPTLDPAWRRLPPVVIDHVAKERR